MVRGYMAHDQWPTKNLSSMPARSLVFKLQVSTDDPSGLGQIDSSVANAPSE